MTKVSYDDVTGTVVIQEEDGFFKLPRRYANADAIVYRDPSNTVDMPSGSPIEHFYFDPRVDRNPNLAPDRISLKVYGEEPEVFRVENPERVDVPED